MITLNEVIKKVIHLAYPPPPDIINNDGTSLAEALSRSVRDMG